MDENKIVPLEILERHEGEIVSLERAVTENLYPVMEIFSSVQGEGAMIGMPVTFVRFAGCNLQCPWCDTKESWVTDADKDGKSEKFSWMKMDDIIEKIDRPIVVFTGGEPCLQDLEPLIELLHMKEVMCCVETNGTLPSPNNVDYVTCSPKPPEYTIHSGCFFNELKYVVDEQFDPEQCIPEEQKQSCGTVWLQPMSHDKDSADRAYKMCMENTYLRMGIQMHKVWGVR